MAKRKRNTRRKKKKSTFSGPGMRVALLSFGLVFSLLLLFSCLSFSIADPPSQVVYPQNHPTHNLCGSVGAFFAYYLLYYFGPGVHFLLLAAVAFFGLMLARREIEQLFFRCIGLALLIIAGSVTFYRLWPHSLYPFPTGSGGLLGVLTADFLERNFAGLGTFILVCATWIVGLILLADHVVMAVPYFCGGILIKLFAFLSPAVAAAKERSEGLSGIWKRLNERQKAQLEKAAPRKKPKKKPNRVVLATAEPVEEEEVWDEAEVLDEDVDQKIENLEEEEPIEEEQDEMLPETTKPEPETEAERLQRLRALTANSAGARGQKKPYVQPSYDDYTLPPLDLLAEAEEGYAESQAKQVKGKAALLEKSLGEFNITAKVVAAETGPTVTMYELDLAAGIKVSRITALSNDMARALGASCVRVVAPLPGKHTIGIEVPNSEKEKVRLKSMIETAGSRFAKMQIPVFFGKDSSGESLVSDLAKMPHMLIAGTTGSGKSVCINSIIVSILMTKRPDEVKLVMVDPKMVEMTAFNAVPHLLCPIITETQMAMQILEWATVKMDERYSVLAEARVKNIAEFNALGAEEVIRRFNPTTPDEEAKIPKKLPYLVIIIDELADLMMTASKEIEAFIVRLAQKSRAVGIHLVLATQRPQATVVTGLIKSNMPCRVGFRVAARMDSRIILDQNGAETLLGEGDMLFLKPGTSDLIRAQGTFLDNQEIAGVVKHLKEIAEPQFHPELSQLKTIDPSAMQKDDLFDDAVRIVLESKRGSVSLLQRRLSIGYARSSRIIEMMAAAGILGDYKGSQAREVLMTLDEYEAVCRQMERDATDGYADLAEDPEPEAETTAETPVASPEEEPPFEVEAQDADVEDGEEELEDEEVEDDDEEYEYVDEDEEEEEDDEEGDEDDEEYEYEYVDEDEEEDDEEYEYVDEKEEEEDEETPATPEGDIDLSELPQSSSAKGERQYMAMDLDEE